MQSRKQNASLPGSIERRSAPRVPRTAWEEALSHTQEFHGSRPSEKADIKGVLSLPRQAEERFFLEASEESFSSGVKNSPRPFNATKGGEKQRTTPLATSRQRQTPCPPGSLERQSAFPTPLTAEGETSSCNQERNVSRSSEEVDANGVLSLPQQAEERFLREAAGEGRPSSSIKNSHQPSAAPSAATNEARLPRSSNEATRNTPGRHTAGFTGEPVLGARRRTNPAASGTSSQSQSQSAPTSATGNGRDCNFAAASVAVRAWQDRLIKRAGEKLLLSGAGRSVAQGPTLLAQQWAARIQDHGAGSRSLVEIAASSQMEFTGDIPKRDTPDGLSQRTPSFTPALSANGGEDRSDEAARLAAVISQSSGSREDIASPAVVFVDEPFFRDSTGLGALGTGRLVEGALPAAMRPISTLAIPVGPVSRGNSVADEELSNLSAKMKRILDEEARRYGIDV
jgi:hypothetical protein